MNNVIYEPKGRAEEYAPHAVNLYVGCSHGCKYCYAPAVVRRKPEDFHKGVKPRKDILQKLESAAANTETHGQVLLCFTSDPYQPAELEYRVTRQAITILCEAGHKVTVLTKNGPNALQDLDLFKKHGVTFATTMVFAGEDAIRHWEPGAPPLADRVNALRTFHDEGIDTWVSLEPVIYPDHAFEVIRVLSPWVNLWKVGKVNHMPEIEKGTDWPEFRRKAVELMQSLGAKYYIKKDLREAK